MIALIKTALEALIAIPKTLELIQLALSRIEEARLDKIRSEISEVTAKLKRKDLTEVDKFEIAYQLQNLTRKL